VGCRGGAVSSSLTGAWLNGVDGNVHQTAIDVVGRRWGGEAKIICLLLSTESHACGGGCKTESHQCESAWTDLSASLKSWSTPWMEHTHHLPRLISGYFLAGGGGKFHNKNFCNHSTSINLRNHASRIWKCSHRSRNLGRFAS
jgi:hypothetical protein